MSATYDAKAYDTTLEQNLDILWLLFGAYLVFFMQVRARACYPGTSRNCRFPENQNLFRNEEIFHGIVSNGGILPYYIPLPS